MSRAIVGINAKWIAIGGGSAGSGRAAAFVQRTHDDGRVKPVFQVLMYPMIDVLRVGLAATPQP
ncbi:MAG: alpha/beta hydrolase fold domain-containing protein [Candidatus Acidiferrum sp.]